jgi:hypothetical protein
MTDEEHAAAIRSAIETLLDLMTEATKAGLSIYVGEFREVYREDRTGRWWQRPTVTIVRPL